MYCPYCGTDHEDDAIPFSKEHAVPYAIGGSNGLIIFTCAISNNNLGSEVDAPFMTSFPVASKRFFLGLESHNGNPPTFDLGGTGWVDDKEVPISYLISATTKELKIARPNIVKTPREDGSEQWHVSGDPAEVRRILEGKLLKQLALGKTVTLEDGSLLRLEDLDRLFIQRMTTLINPSVVKTIQHDYLVYIRFFNKVALAMGHLHFGEAFSRSETGDRLRRNINAQSMEDLTFPGHIWPEIDSVQSALQIVAKPDHHTIVVMEGKVPVILISLFGEIGALIPLGEPIVNRLPLLSDHGTVWRIALPSRALTRLTIQQMIAERLETLRRARPEFKQEEVPQ